MNTHFIFIVSPSPPDDPLSTDSSELSTNGEKSATTSISTNKIKKPKEKKEDPEVIRKWKEQQVILLVEKHHSIYNYTFRSYDRILTNIQIL